MLNEDKEYAILKFCSGGEMGAVTAGGKGFEKIDKGRINRFHSG